jgi:molybdopterin converting factor subunit 1
VIHVRLLFFAQLRDATEVGECVVSLPMNASGEDIRAWCVAHHPSSGPLLASTRIAINEEYSTWDTVVHDGDEIALVPPVSGG